VSNGVLLDTTYINKLTVRSNQAAGRDSRTRRTIANLSCSLEPAVDRKIIALTVSTSSIVQRGFSVGITFKESLSHLESQEMEVRHASASTPALQRTTYRL
jgi:hypothetical protein